MAPSPALAAATCGSVYSLCQGVPDREQVEADLGLYHSGNPRVCTPRRQLQSTLEYHPTTSTSHGGRWLLARGHSQAYQLSGLGKSLPLTCQQQSGLIYKRREYLAYMKDTPQVPSLGDRGGCATGPYRTPTSLGHATKTWS